MKIVFRADASLPIGSGHIMRCLTLAEQLRGNGAEILFVCREHQGNLVDLLDAKGYRVARLPHPKAAYLQEPEDVAQAAWLAVPWQQDARETDRVLGDEMFDWLVIDHYGIDFRWETLLRPRVARLMVIDDIADRRHDCDILLDQNLYRNMGARYRNLVPETCKMLLGPEYALLRTEFSQARTELGQRSGEIRRVLVFFGGVDPSNETMKVLAALVRYGDSPLHVDAVVGAANPFKDQVRKFCAEHEGYSYHCQIDNMAQLMAAADLVIGAGGSATWERCFLGLPSITLTNADNQVETTRAVAEAGATIFLGRCADVSSDNIISAFRHLMQNPALACEMGKKAISIMKDSHSGGAAVISNYLLGCGNDTP